MNIDFSRVKNLTYDSKSLKKLELDNVVVWPAVKFYDYLEGDRLAYIDTHYQMSYYDTIKTKFNIIDGSNTNLNTFSFLGYYSNNNRSVSLAFSLDDRDIMNSRWFNRVIRLGQQYINKIYELTYNKDGVSGDINMEFPQESVPSSTTTSGSLTLMKLITSTGYANGILRLYYTQFYDDQGNLIRDFRPCLYKGEAGLWESVENKFYGNANSTGSFTVGNEEN